MVVPHSGFNFHVPKMEGRCAEGDWRGRMAKFPLSKENSNLSPSQVTLRAHASLHSAQCDIFGH